MGLRNFFPRPLLILITFLLPIALAWDISNENDRHGCQAPSRNPLEGCDLQRTIYVDRVSNSSRFKTVQSGRPPYSKYENLQLTTITAVASLPNNTGRFSLYDLNTNQLIRFRYIYNSHRFRKLH